ncbi:hypothetical protein ACOMHN_063850 [Nucella lapillus]
MPPVPRTVRDININGAWGETWEQQRFLLHMDADLEIAVFATDENIETLQRCQLLFIDATFRCCPRPYKQMFTILGQFQGHVVPLVYALMTRRGIGQYRQVFQCVKTAVRERTHHHWRPAHIVCDFERELWTSIETELPRARLQGCYFHFTQILFRKVQELGLAVGYRRNNRLQRFIRKVLAICYIPTPVMMMTFNRLLNHARTRRLLRRYPALGDFITYFRRTYLGPQALFPPASWSVTDRDMNQRTNNSAESFHKAFGSAVGVRRPNLWMFIRVLKDRQSVTENTFEAARRGQPAPRRRRKWRFLEARLTTLKEEYNAAYMICGIAAPWHCGPVALRPRGIADLWHCGPVALRPVP